MSILNLSADELLTTTRAVRQGHGVQACLQAAGDAGRPLGSVVLSRGAGTENLIALSAWESDRSRP